MHQAVAGREWPYVGSWILPRMAAIENGVWCMCVYMYTYTEYNIIEQHIMPIRTICMAHT